MMLSKIIIAVNWLRTALFVLTFIIAMPVQALTVQANGQAIIVSGDLTSARNIAINRAKQQAALQASAYISTEQQLEQGVIIQDNLSIKALAQVGQHQILKETISGNLLTVLISVEISSHNKCSNGQSASHFRKRVAVAAFPMA